MASSKHTAYFYMKDKSIIIGGEMVINEWQLCTQLLFAPAILRARDIWPKDGTERDFRQEREKREEKRRRKKKQTP